MSDKRTKRRSLFTDLEPVRGINRVKWCGAIGLSVAASIVSLVGVWWVAKQSTNLPDFVVYGVWVAPFLAFLLAYYILAKWSGEWPVDYRGVRLTISGIVAVQGALVGYLSYVLVSFAWHEERLPPEKASLVYLVFHPTEVPPLRNSPQARKTRCREADALARGGLYGFLHGRILRVHLCSRKRKPALTSDRKINSPPRAYYPLSAK